jgi:hypothetical protein
MVETKIRFDDGAAYEQIVGSGAGSPARSSSIGWRRFRVCDGSIISCGNGAFTELIVERCAPMEVQGRTSLRWRLRAILDCRYARRTTGRHVVDGKEWAPTPWT